MNIDLTRLFPRGKKPDVRITTRRNMILRIDGLDQHVPSGSEVSIPHEQFRQLDASDYQLVTMNRPPEPAVPDPTPARPEHAPLPHGWEKLPPCFHEFHSITEAIRTAREHIDMIRQKRVELFGSAIKFGDAEGRFLSGALTVADTKKAGNLYSSVREIDASDPATRRIDRFLTVAENAALDHLKHLIETKDLPQQRLFLECGQHRINQAEKLQAISRELAETGFQIFSLRIQALGLHESKVRSLYVGSADCVRFTHQTPSHIGGICFGGLEDDGTVRRFSGVPIEAAAGHLISDSARLKELEPLLDAGRKELAQARKAAAKAAA